MQGFGTVTSVAKISEFVDVLEKSFSQHIEVSYSLLLSMELYSSSHFENNNRSRLIMIMSALEALAGQLDLSDKLGSLIKDLKGTVKGTQIEDQRLKDSLIGQIDELKRESVRGAIQRLLLENGSTMKIGSLLMRRIGLEVKWFMKVKEFLS